VESKQDKDVEIVVDITGSDGAAIEGTYATKKSQMLKPKSLSEVCKVKLFGDWLIRIKFTYTIKNYGKGSAAPQNLLAKKMGGININDVN
jgi:hypothetical protein